MHSSTKKASHKMAREAHTDNSSFCKTLHDEVRFWVFESDILKNILLGGTLHTEAEKRKLHAFRLELNHFQGKVFPGYQRLLNDFDLSVLKEAEKLRLEKHQQNIKRAYMELKRQLMPFIQQITKPAIQIF